MPRSRLNQFVLSFICVSLFIGTLIFMHSDASAQTAATSAWIPEALISFDFDDGDESAYISGLPVINAAGYKATEYIVSGRIGAPGFVSASQVLDMQAKGNEIGGHTVHHVNLAQASDAVAEAEIEGSRQDLLKLGIRNVTAFAYPFGAATSTTPHLVQNAGFLAARLTYPGYNDPSIHPYELRRFALNASTTPASAFEAIDYAIAHKKWLILVMHQIDENDSQSISSGLLKQIVAYVKERNLKVVTATEGFKLVYASTSPITTAAASTAASALPIANVSASDDTALPPAAPAVYPLDKQSSATMQTIVASPKATTEPLRAGEVLGVSTFHFSRQLWRSMSGDDVLELQKILIKEGFLHIPSPTRYFGMFTEHALKTYQSAHGLGAVGRAGPKTLALLNSTSPSAPSASDIGDQGLVQGLMRRVEALLAQITALKAASTTR